VADFACCFGKNLTSDEVQQILGLAGIELEKFSTLASDSKRNFNIAEVRQDWEPREARIQAHSKSNWR
jgi:hypothetical protein